MRWLSLFIFFFPFVSQAIDINNTDSIKKAIDNKEDFSFFYIGHAYGAHNDGGKTNKQVFPHPELLKNIENLKKYDLGVFGGDIVEICNQQSVNAFDKLLLKPLEIPIINSMGNHDGCLQSMLDFPTRQSITTGKNTFLILSTSQLNFNKQDVAWLLNQLNTFNSNSTSKNLFIFTHRPTFMLLNTPLRSASSYANFPVSLDANFTSTFNQAFSTVAKNKNIYWFAGDFGQKKPYAYSTLSNNIHFIASGIYERESDHFLDVHLTSSGVEIRTRNLINGNEGTLYDFTSKEYQNSFLPGREFDEGWSQTMLSDIYASINLEEGKIIIPVNAQNDENRRYNFYYRTHSNSILLKNNDCGAEADNLFFIQYHPVNVADRRITKREWNGYHFYATRTNDDSKQCVAVIPLPDYPIKFIRTGQLTKERKLLWLAEVKSKQFTSKHMK